MRERRFDYTLFALVIILLTIGVIMIYSASAFIAQVRGLSSEFFFKKQIMWFIMAIATILIVSRINYHHWQKLAWPIMLGSLVMLVAVLTQREINGSRRWLFVFNQSLQPSEVFKYALVIFTAYYLCRKREMLSKLKALAWPWGALAALGMGLILLQPDLGMVLIIMMTTFVLLFMAGLKYRYVLTGVLAPVALAGFMVFVADYKSARLEAFLHPENSTLAEVYHQNQSLMAIGAGKLAGVGIGRGMAKLSHLPESHTDFIIANVAEEGGFVTVLLCLAFYFIIVVRGLRIASLAQDHFGFYLAFGIVSILTLSIIINISVAVRLLPTTGMTLPFLSYGGSSIICSSFGIGILLNISRHQYKVSKLLEKRRG
ncbi:MAG TPA: putative lipid II flippase FtsW [candidate division Zixibacteria bacterium]|nr:putative lipid II flippase FtsW [candidate division Zixibacteria bacterium]